MDRAKNTPLHVIVLYKKIVSDFLTLHAIILALLESGWDIWKPKTFLANIFLFYWHWKQKLLSMILPSSWFQLNYLLLQKKGLLRLQNKSCPNCLLGSGAATLSETSPEASLYCKVGFGGFSRSWDFSQCWANSLTFHRKVTFTPLTLQISRMKIATSTIAYTASIPKHLTSII